MYVYYNPNPRGRTTAGDCAIRAVSKALGTDWGSAFAKIVVNSFRLGDVMSSDAVWGAVLRQNGFVRESLPNTCPDCFTVRDFCAEHPSGVYVLGTGNHAIAVVNGDYYDSWDSGGEIPQFYWRRV